TDESFLTNRRTYMKAAGAAAVSVPLLAGEGAAATERHGLSFDTVVDMVDDAGCDPGGNEPCDGTLDSVAGDNTLLRFPSGTYKFTEQNTLNGYNNIGVVGEGDVTFTVPDDFADKILTINYGSGALVENITIDQSNATPCVQVAPDDNLEVHGLSMVGEGISSATGTHPGGEEAPNAFNPMVRSSGGEGMVEDITLHNEGRMGAYGRVGVWIGEKNEGTITLRNCNVEGFSGNGVYASRTPGVVQVEGGTYKNNDLSQVRIGSAGSYVEGATAEVDLSESNSPNPDEMLNGSGIRIESDRGGSGAEIRDCDVRIGPEVNADTGIKVFSNYPHFSIENTRVEFNPDEAYAIRAASPDGSSDVSGTLQNVSVTGEADNFVGVLIEDRPGTTVENCCIQQTGSSRIGLALDNCDGSQVTDCTINASAQALRIRNCDVAVSNIEESGTCPAPNLSSSSYDGSSSSDSSSEESSEESSSAESSSDESSSSSDSSSEESSDSAEESSSDESSSNSDGSGSDDELSGDIEESEVPEPPEDANLIITDTDSAGDRIPYEVTTSGGIDHANAYGATVDDNDPISGNTADGGVNQWRDAYAYEGEIVALEVDDHATIKLDQSAHTIKVLGHDASGTDYSLEVSGTLEHADDSSDPISDGRVEGGVGTFRDVYTYSGELIQASIEDGVSITTQPETLEE
ncbi:MAG TPA: right-handed parallel beta-helix repeat-containing protein, partial [Halococcus sp.]|nr:right-handed parallel beta-helix repeat-containing protein [Halococcus sp.]